VKNTPEYITYLEPNQVFVFGSNLRGRHGAGAAKQALKFGARMGQGRGFCGQTYAIPTKGRNMEVLPLWRIERAVSRFLDYAWRHPELEFLVTRVGCGLAGYKDKDIAPMFHTHPGANLFLHVILPEGW